MNHRRRHVRAGRHEQLVLQFSAGVVHPHVDAVVQPRVADAAEGGAVRLPVAGITRGPSPTRREPADAPSNARRTRSCCWPPSCNPIACSSNDAVSDWVEATNLTAGSPWSRFSRKVMGAGGLPIAGGARCRK